MVMRSKRFEWIVVRQGRAAEMGMLVKSGKVVTVRRKEVTRGVGGGGGNDGGHDSDAMRSDR